MPPRVLVVAFILTALVWVVAASPASADSTVLAFPAEPAADDGVLSCLPLNPFCVLGEAAGAVVADVWISAMLSLWGAGLWLLGLAFSVIDALATPDLSADGPLAGVYPVTFGIGATVAAVMALVQLGLAAVRRDGQTLGRLLVGLVQFGLVWAGYVAVAALLVTGVSGLTTALLRSLLGIDTMAAFDPSISVGRDLVDGTVATVLGVSSIFLLVPASVGYLLLMLVREAALIVLTATSAISAGGLLAQTSSAWFWRSLRWFLAALLVSPVAVLVLGVGVTITEGIVTGAEETSTEAAVGMAVVGCLLILLGAICPLALFRLLAFVDPGTSSGAALRSSLAASGGIMGALGNLGGAGGRGAAVAAAAGSGGVAASGAAAQLTGDRAQGESTADTATSGRFAGALHALTVGTATAGRLAAGVAASAADVLSGAGVGHSAPYYGQSAPGRAAPGGHGFGPGTPRLPRPGRPTRREDGAHPLGPLSPGPHGAPGDGNGGPVAVAWPAQHIDGTGPGGGDEGDPPAPRMPRTDDGPGDGGGR
jgi:type IV secretion system protein TrbL